MPELSAQLPAIIGEAAKSPLGIFALMIISLAILGFFFFKEAAEKTRIAIFVMLFVGVAVFGLSIVRTTSAAAPASGAAPATGTAPAPGDSGAEPAGAPAATTTPTAAAAAAEAASITSLLGTWTGDVTYFRPRTFQETFIFEMIGGELAVRPTFLGSERNAVNLRVANGTVRFDVKRGEIDGDKVTDIVSSYVLEIHPDRIQATMSNDNGDPTTRFQLRKAAGD